jgi:SAM-dependent methyltransferase
MPPTVLEMLEPSPLMAKAAGAIRRAKRLFGIPSYMRTEDRRVLEQVIHPYFLQSDQYSNILSVGCQWFTQGYNRPFEAVKSYATIDFLPDVARFGGQRHIVDGLQNIGAHFQPGSLDLILCNGIFGWGLNERADVEQGFQACHTALRSGGVLLIGWNDVPERRPFPIDECQSLAQFQPFVFPPLGVSRHLTNTPYRHVFDFHVKG